MLQFVKVRDAMFTTAGFNLAVSEIASGSWKGRNWSFVVNDAEGKLLRMEPMVSDCDPALGEIYVRLKPYRGEPLKAAAMVLAMTKLARAARAGKKEAQRAMASALAIIVADELPFANEKDCLGLLAALYGRGRVLDELNRRGTTVGLKEPLDRMIAEAYAFVST